MRRIKASIIAIMALFSQVDFRKKRRVHISLKRNKHRRLFAVLEFLFDVRTNGDGTVTLHLKQRPKANYERGL